MTVRQEYLAVISLEKTNIQVFLILCYYDIIEKPKTTRPNAFPLSTLPIFRLAKEFLRTSSFALFQSGGGEGLVAGGCECGETVGLQKVKLDY